MKCAVSHCGRCQLGPTFVCREGPVFRLRRDRAVARDQGALMSPQPKPKLAVWKFASCDGCQLSLLDLEDELLAHRRTRSRSPTSSRRPRGEVEGPYDLSLVEGSITTAARRRADPARSARPRAAWSPSAPARRRAASRPCATSPTSTEFVAAVYATPVLHLDARHLDADQRPRRRSTSSSRAARSTSTSCSR